MNETGTKKRLFPTPGIRVFRNKDNHHKYLEVVTYEKCHHYYWRPYMKFENGVINPIGDKVCKLKKVRRSTLEMVLDDYEEVTNCEKPIDYQGYLYSQRRSHS